jgi:hypothetical protein
MTMYFLAGAMMQQILSAHPQGRPWGWLNWKDSQIDQLAAYVRRVDRDTKTAI